MRRTQILVAALVVVGCGGTSPASEGSGGSGATPSGGGGGTGGAAPFDAALEHTFAPIMVESGSDDFWCQSWKLNNEEPIYLNKVRQTNDGAWHHSNWFHVPEDRFAGEDGSWRCADRNFSELEAAVWGGTIFAQSTQSFEEVQEFPEGTALIIPPHSQIIGNVHLFNVSAAPVETTLTMGFATVEKEDAKTKLREMTFSNPDIKIPAQRRSRWSQTCDLTDHLGDSVNVYYVLGHYHGWGNYFQLSFVNDDGTETPVVELDNVGDNLGRTIAPPVNSGGAKKMRYSCGYNNTTDRELVFGNSGEAEMCVFLAYVDGDRKIAIYPAGNVPEPMGEDEDGVLMFDVPCDKGSFASIPAND
ncbi:MAG: hypothetical protein WBG86_16265 [Polyangiales bacterium]